MVAQGILGGDASMRSRSAGSAPVTSHPRRSGEALADAVIPLGVGAPALARNVVLRCLGGRVAPSVIRDAELLVSELVTNSVRHSGSPAGADVVVRVSLAAGACRLEVEDPGRGSAFASRPPDSAAVTGMGLNLVRMLSERWGVVRSHDAPTCVWAQLAREPRVLL
jgi:anti-sigma regulatory factor (Ser/Thr protein kinase)